MLTDDEKLLIEKASEATGLSVDEMEDFYLKMKSFINDVCEVVKRKINNISEIFAEIVRQRNKNMTFHVPKNIIRDHQVLNRKPMFSHIRNSI